MTANKKDTGKVVRRIVLTGLLTTLIFTCDKIPEYCGDGHALDNPATQFCFGGETYTKCGGEVWRPDVQRCDEGGVLKTQCPGSDEFYNNVTEFCEDGKPHRRCGGEAYNTSAQVCVGSEVRTPCDGGRTVPAGQPCDGYILSTTAAPAEGGTVEPATQSYTPGALVGVTAKAAEGYTFTGWSGASTATSPTISVTMDGDKSLVAIFSQVVTDTTSYCLTITVIPNNSSGTVTRNPDKQCYDPGTPVTVTAEAAQNYKFTGWGGASTSSNPAIVITMDSPKALIANFEAIPITYTLTTPQADGGSVTRNPVQTSYSAGASVTVTATPNLGYSFTGWSGASTSTNETVTITMNDDKELIATFRRNTYTLTATASAGGSVSRDPNRTSYDHGTQVTVTAIPENSYTFAGWSGASSSVSAQVTITMDGNKELHARFQQIPVNHYTLSVNSSPTNGGTVSRNPDNASYPQGTQVTATAIPAPGYSFTRWSVASTATTPSVTLTMNVNATLTANFQINSYTLNTNAEPSAGGSIYVNYNLSTVPTTHSHGTAVNISATNNAGYRFTNWTVTSGTATFNNVNNSTTTVTLSSDATIRANFSRITYTLTTAQNLTDGGTVTASETNPDSGAVVDISATVNPGYRFTNWTVTSGTATFGSATSASTTVRLSSNATIRANYSRVTYTLTINRDPTAGGTATPTSGLSHDSGSVVNIAALSASGYTFNGWTISGSGTIANATSASTSVTVNGNVTATANFQQQYTVTYSVNGGSGTTPTAQTVDAGASITLASGNGITRNNHTFAGWNTNSSGTGTNYSAGSSFTPTANITLYARWIALYTVTYNINSGTGTAPASQTVSAGNSVTLDAGTGITRNGYTFGGWNTNSSGTGTNYSVGSSFTPTANTTLYARWTQTPGGQFNPNISYGTLTDSRDGKTYRTAVIGTQTWMAENLNYNTSGSSCHNNNSDNCDLYGRLYNWATVMDGALSSNKNPSEVQGICPNGWHVPSDAEWTALTNAVGGLSTAGKVLKSASGWYSGGNGTDDYGFSALPGGDGDSGGDFYGAGYRGLWWSATERDASDAWYRSMYYNYDFVDRHDNYKTLLFSVRCLRDSAAPQ